MKMSKQVHRWLGLQSWIFYVLLVVIIGLLGFLGNTFKFEADWTYGNRNSLSAPTQALLKTLDKPLKFIAYIPERPDLEAELRKMIGKYQRIKTDTSIEFVNPDLDPVRAKQDGIQYAGQLAIHLGERSEVVEAANEQVIMNAIQRMSRGGERLVIFLEGHGERNPLASESNGMSTLVTSLQRNGFKIQPHNLLRSQSIPQNASFVVIASPQQDLTAGEVEILKKYVEQGGNLLWLQDPGGLHGLQPLADQLGIRIGTGTAIDANPNLQALLGINHPAVVPVIDYANAEIVQKMAGQQTLFPFTTSVERLNKSADAGDTTNGWQITEFLNSLPTSWLETSGVLEGSVKYDEGSGDIAGPLPLGVVMSRPLEAPKDKPEAKAHEQRLVVVGDSDFLLNSFVGQGANLDLATNIFNWLSVDDNLLQVPINRAPDTQLEMSDLTGYLIGIFFLFIMPTTLLAAGTWLWWRRRKR